MQILAADGLHHGFPSICQRASGEVWLVNRRATAHFAAGVFGTLDVRRSSDSGETWTAPVTLVQVANRDVRVGLIRELRSGRMVVVYAHAAPPALNHVTAVMYSDDGTTWTHVPLPALFTEWQTVECPVVELPDRDGHLLLATYGKHTGNATITAVCWESWDGGASWVYKSTITSHGTAAEYGEPWLQYLTNGKVLCLVRSATTVWRLESSDFGATWSDPVVMLPETGRPNVIELPNGRLRFIGRRTRSPQACVMTESATLSGSVWGPLTVLDSTATMMAYADQVVLPDGRTLVTWAQEGPTTRADLKVHHLPTATGVPIVSQVPAAASSVAPSSRVTLTAQTPPVVTVPSVVGCVEAVGTLRLRQAGLGV